MFILGTNLKLNTMPFSIPSFKEKVLAEDIMVTLEESYSVIAPIWVPLQVQWMNGVYGAFKDYEKFMIIMHLLSKTFNFYSENFVRLSYEEFFNQKQIEIEKYNIIDIAKSLKIPRETARRKVKELEAIGYLKRIQKKIVIDGGGAWPSIQPIKTINRLSRFFSTFSKILYEKKIILELTSSEELTKTIKEYFSHVWKLYYDLQIPMLLNNKRLHNDLETFHIWGVCVVNQFINSNKNDNNHLSKEYFLEKYIFKGHEELSGVNALSISDISGIPRATVIRKLNKLIKKKFLKIDSKKHYATSGFHKKELLVMQKQNFIRLSKFAASIYNLNIHQKIK